MKRLLPLCTLLLCASAAAQLRADIAHDTPAGQATMRVFDGKKLLFTATTQGLNGVTKSKFSPDGKWLINIADGSGYVQLWDVEKGERVKTFLAKSRIFGVDFTPDSERVLLDFSDSRNASDPKRPAYFPLPTMLEIKTLKTIAYLYNDKRESYYERAVSFSKDGKRMIFASSGSYGSYGPASVWDAKTGQHLITFPRLPYPKGAGQTGGAGSVDARLSPNGLRALVQYIDGRLAEYDATTGELLKVRGKPSEASAKAQLEQFAAQGK